MASKVQFDTRDAVDFVIIGSGSAGGILAKELSTAGFDVVVLEQGPYRKASDFTHDELSVVFRHELQGGGHEVHGQTFRHDESETASSPRAPPVRYARGVGGSSVHFTANFWRFRESRLQGTQPARADLRHQFRRLADQLRGARALLHEGRLGDRRYRARRARSMRRAPGRSRCRRCRSSRPACCSRRAPRRSVCTRRSSRSPSCHSRTTAGPPVSAAVIA